MLDIINETLCCWFLFFSPSCAVSSQLLPYQPHPQLLLGQMPNATGVASNCHNTFMPSFHQWKGLGLSPLQPAENINPVYANRCSLEGRENVWLEQGLRGKFPCIHGQLLTEGTICGLTCFPFVLPLKRKLAPKLTRMRGNRCHSEDILLLNTFVQENQKPD